MAALPWNDANATRRDSRNSREKETSAARMEDLLAVDI